MTSALDPGVVLSHYQIVGRLGAGGMGEVYKAHDTALGRSVALKVLPPHLVRNEERTRRFVQEARSASSLNHPNIITIYEIGEVSLTRSGEEQALESTPIHYIAMELVEGVTLKARIYDESASLRTLLGHIAQAAEGLAKAHAAGIVHRDLKPENIMVTADGFAKVLDFGLAKLTLPQPASDAHTRTMAMHDDTGEGVILGTVAYMSPEQVKGKTADHRSDIFAIGTILYEAATRRRPFVADSDVEVMHKILHDKPEPVDDLNPNVPAELRRTIRRCLAKEPDRRFQSMKDVAIELAEIVEEFDQLSMASSASATKTSVGSSLDGRTLAPGVDASGGRWKVAALIAVVAIAGAVLVGVYGWAGSRDAPAAPVSFESMKIEPLTASGRAFRAPAISPDGRFVAYVSRAQTGFSLSMRQIATGSEVKIVPDQPTQLQALTFSPDGNYLYYTSSGEGSGNVLYSWLFVVPTVGGQPRKVIYDVDTAVAFSPDGKQIAFGRGVPAEQQNHVIVANADGSGARKIAGFLRMRDATRPTWSPDGTKVLTAAINLEAGWNFALMEIDVASGSTRRVGTTRRFSLTDMEFLPDGGGLLLAGADAESAREQLWLQPYPDGVPVRVTNDLSDYRGLSMTRDGSTAAALKTDTQTWLAATGLDERGLGSTLSAAGVSGLENLRVSRSGAVTYSFDSGNSKHIAVLDSIKGQPRVLTREGFNGEPAISGDGRIIVFAAEGRNSPPHVFAIDADGTNLRQLTNGSDEVDPDISADGKTLLYRANLGREIWVRPLAGGEPTRISDRANFEARLSPDGRHVLFFERQAEAGATVHVRIVPVTGGEAILDVPWVRGVDLRWHPRGGSFTFRRSDRGVTNLFTMPITGGEPTKLTNFESGTFASYDWTPDGGLILVRTSATSDIVLIRDWWRPNK